MRNKLLIIAKILISVGLVTLLLRGSDLDAIRGTLATADNSLLLFAFLLFFLVYGLIAKRWQLLLKAQQVSAGLGLLVQSFAISVFFNNFLPSTVGGDIYRMYDSWRLGARRSVAVSVVLIDRVIGLFTLLLYALASTFFVPIILQQIPQLQILLLFMAGVLLIIGWIVFSSAGRKLEQTLESNHPSLRKPLKVIAKLIASFTLYRGRHDVLFKAIGLSFVVHFTVIIHHVLIALALGIKVPVSAIFQVIPLSFLLMMLPVSINGIGLREAIFVFLFAPFGVSQEQAIAFAWASFGMILAQGMLGGLVFLVRKPQFRDIRNSNHS